MFTNVYTVRVPGSDNKILIILETNEGEFVYGLKDGHTLITPKFFGNFPDSTWNLEEAKVAVVKFVCEWFKGYEMAKWN
jgi:hypothetical protein